MLRTLTAVLLVAASVAAITRHPLVVVLSFDGFRADYVHPDVTPNLAQFKKTGASPPYMRNVFPTKTFVNHFTMATGLYPETHGVLDNYMFDRDNKTMHYTYEMFHYNELVMPIWVRLVRRSVAIQCFQKNSELLFRYFQNEAYLRVYLGNHNNSLLMQILINLNDISRNTYTFSIFQ